MPPKLKKFLQSWAINTLAVLVAVVVLPGHIRYDKPLDLLMASLILGILNAFLRPVLMLLALPLLILSLGLFMLVINALLLYFVGWFVPGFHVAGFWWAFLGALIISLVSLVLNTLTGSGKSRIVFHRRKGPPDSHNDDGPIINV